MKRWQAKLSAELRAAGTSLVLDWDGDVRRRRPPMYAQGESQVERLCKLQLFPEYEQPQWEWSWDAPRGWAARNVLATMRCGESTRERPLSAIVKGVG